MARVTVSPIREVINATRTCLSRELITDASNDLRKKWKLLRFGLIALLCIPKYRKVLMAIAERIDLSKARPSLLDRYWMFERWDFDFDGKEYDERIALRKEMDKGFEQELYREHAAPPPGVAIMGNIPFRLLTTEQAQKVIEMASKDYMAKAWPKYRINPK